MSITFATRAPKALQTAAATLTVYYFDVSNAEQAAEYAAIVEGRRAAGVAVWSSQSPQPFDKKFSDYWKSIDTHAGRPYDPFGARGVWSAPVTVELEFVFDNQMNSAAPLNARLFDWSEPRYPNANIKHGYFVESDELRRARETTCACGYCGAQYENAEPGQFCAACLESQYLKIDELHLLRLRRIADKSNASRSPLTAEERAELLPMFEKARTEGITKRGIARRAKQRAVVAAEFDKVVKEATIKRNAYSWLLDNGIEIDNVIYYAHRDVFTFGWRQHVEGAELDRLRGKLTDFPFNYEINPSK
jgi:hypothetical protein